MTRGNGQADEIEMVMARTYNKPLTIAEKLAKRLKKEFSIEAQSDGNDKEVLPKRIYAGHWQRSEGAWSWYYSTLLGDVGSHDTMKECLNSKNLVYDHSDGTFSCEREEKKK